MAVRVIAGLGNPGRQYEHTRHNLGFMVLDRLAEDHLVAGQVWKERFRGALAEIQLEGNRILLFKPLQFMNLSGGPLAELMQFYHFPVAELAVVHDEIDLPLGKLRLRQGGGDGGHNGVASAIQAFSDPNFIRLRVGIDRPSDSSVDVSSWVLSGFGVEERIVVDTVIGQACQALKEVVRSGLKIAQNLYN